MILPRAKRRRRNIWLLVGALLILIPLGCAAALLVLYLEFGQRGPLPSSFYKDHYGLSTSPEELNIEMRQKFNNPFSMSL